MKTTYKSKQKDYLWVSLLIGLLVLLALIYFNWADAPLVVGGAILLVGTIIVAAFAGWKPSLQLTLTSLALAAFVALCAIASVYSKFQEYASVEVTKWFVLLVLFLVASFTCKKKHARVLMLGVAFAIALVAVFSIDSASFKLPSDFILKTILHNDTSGYGYWGDGRISGLFTNPNITGSIFGLGIFLSLHLARTARSRKEQLLTYGCLATSALAFLLSFSMGSIVFFTVGVVVYLVAAGKQERPGLLVLMLETVAGTMLFAVLSTLGLGKSGAIALVPDLCMVASCALLWLVDTKVGTKLAAKLAQNSRALGIGLGGVAALAVLYLIAGFNLTGGMTFAPGEVLSRSAYPAPGGYTLAVDGASDLRVTITAQDSAQTAMHTGSTLYEGKAQGAQFTVPQGAKVLYFGLSSAGGGKVSAVTYSGAETGALKLKYLLIPQFAATRIQGIWANQNVVQRVTFYGDALKIWQKSPIVGMGLGAFEGYHTQVADFNYVTRYAHNVYFQTMAETGLLGLLLLLAAFGLMVLAALRGRKDPEDGGFAAPLLACLALMLGHGSFEVIWSSKPYLVIAALIFALVQICFGAQLPLAVAQKKPVRVAAAALCMLFACSMAWLFLQKPMQDAQMTARMADQDFDGFMRQVAHNAKTNVYGSDFFRVTYLENVFVEEDPDYLAQADAFAAELIERNNYEYGLRAATYFFRRGMDAAAFDAVERSATWGGSDPAAWDAATDLLMQNMGGDTAAKQEAVRRFAALWQEVAAGQLDGLPLTPIHAAFLAEYA